jgi:predicted MFS family arabinose efflux permease
MGLLITASVAALVFIDPALRAAEPTAAAATAGRGHRGDFKPKAVWRLPGMLTLMALAAAVATTLVGTDLLLLAKLRQGGHAFSYGWVAAVWAAGSMVGGLVYGALRRDVPAPLAVAILGALTLPIALTTGVTQVAIAAFAAGLGCAPAMTAITAEITRSVPSERQTEALGWYSSSHTTGATLGSTGVGALVDAVGATLAAVVTGCLATVVGLGCSLSRLRQERSATAEGSMTMKTPVSGGAGGSVAATDAADVIPSLN